MGDGTSEEDADMDLGLRGARALVTGASRGIGLAVATALAGEGADCALLARHEGPLEEAAARLAEATGRRVVPVLADTGDTASVQAAVDRAAAELGGLEVLVNNAARPSGAVDERPLVIDEELLRQDFDEKVVGYLRTARAAVPHMRRSGWGRIVNIGGLAARTPGAVSAGARNAALVHLTASLAADLGIEGITVNAVHPGLTLTEGVRERIAARAEAQGVPVEEALALAGARTALGRVVTAEEVAAVVVFLASPRSVAVTGGVVAAGGGSPSGVWY